MANADLRPMTIGEVLDRTFKLYKSNFWLFTGIMSLPFLFVFLFNISVGLLTSNAMSSIRAGSLPSFSPEFIAVGIVSVVVLFVVVFFLASVGQAATILAVSDLLLGRSASIRGSFQQVRGHILRVIGTILLMGLLLMAVFVVAAAVIIGASVGRLPGLAMGLVILAAFLGLGIFIFIMVCRLSLAVPVAVLEIQSPLSALSRSMALTKGFIMQIFLILLLYFVLAIGVSMVLTFPFLILAVFPAPRVLPFSLVLLQDVCSFIAQVLVAPIQTIAFSLMYYNLRVRKEGFDLEHLMGSLGTAPVSGMPAPGNALPS